MHNFTVADLVQTTLATFALALFLLPAGYLVGMASNCFAFRTRSAEEKILFSALLSVAVVPVLAVLSIRFLTYPGALIVFLLMLLAAVASAIRSLPYVRLRQIDRTTWIMSAMGALWFLIALFSVVDIQIGDGLYVSYMVYDHGIRVPLVEAATRGVPPLNPFYGIGQAPVLRYFYYWYVVCALPARLLGLSARSCFHASTFWSGLCLASAIPLFLKHFFGETQLLRRKSLIGVALLTVTGLDLLPYAVLCLYTHTLVADLEWWDTSQVTSWLGSLLWVPHHVASMTACMAGLLVISAIQEEMARARRIWTVVIAGIAFASAAGLSLYVAFTFALFAMLWTFITLMRREFKSVATYAGIAVVSLLLSAPFLSDLLASSAKSGGGAGNAASAASQFAFFAVRENKWLGLTLAQLGVQSPLLFKLFALLCLLPVYLLEFGFFAVILVIVLRRDRSGKPLSRQQQMAWALLLTCLVAMSVLQSNTTGSNDLGFRGMLLAQFVLLLWAAPVVHGFFRPSSESQFCAGKWCRTILLATMLIGVAGTAGQLLLLRAYSPLAEAHKFARMPTVPVKEGFARRTYWMREVFEQVDRMTSRSEKIQYNPLQDDILVAQLYSTRQEVQGDSGCGSGFGGDQQKCREVLPYFAVLFNRPEIVRTWNVDSLCDDYSVSVLVATDADPVWQDPASWVWQRPALVNTPEARAVTCGFTPRALAPR